LSVPVVLELQALATHTEPMAAIHLLTQLLQLAAVEERLVQRVAEQVNLVVLAVPVVAVVVHCSLVELV
jgi:hypothetical protein